MKNVLLNEGNCIKRIIVLWFGGSVLWMNVTYVLLVADWGN